MRSRGPAAGLFIASLLGCGGKGPAGPATPSAEPAGPGQADLADPADETAPPAGDVDAPPPAATVGLDMSAQPQPPPVTLGAASVRLTGMAGGVVDLADAHRGCAGIATVAPAHVLVVKPGLLRLEIKRTADAPTPTLFVRLPDGRIACGTHATDGQVTLQTSTGPGTVHVWTGAGTTDAPAAYALTVQASLAPAHPGPGLVSAEAVPDGSDLVVGAPVRLACGAFRTDEVMYWTPKGGPRLALGAAARGPFVTVATRVDGGEWDARVDVPEGLSDDGCVQATLKRDGRLLVSAERAASSSGDPGQRMLWLLAYDAKAKTVTVASTSLGTAGAALPSWAK